MLHHLPNGRGILRPLAPRNALWPSGRTRSVEHKSDVSLLYSLVGWVMCRRGDGFVEGVGFLRRIRPHEEQLRVRAEVVAYRQHRFRGRLLQDNHLRLRIADTELDLLAGPAVVNWGVYRSELLAGHVDGAVLLAVLDHLHHAVALADAKFSKRVGHSIDSFVPLGVGVAAVSRHPRQIFRITGRSVFQNLPWHHSGSCVPPCTASQSVFGRM